MRGFLKFWININNQRREWCAVNRTKSGVRVDLSQIPNGCFKIASPLALVPTSAKIAGVDEPCTILGFLMKS